MELVQALGGWGSGGGGYKGEAGYVWGSGYGCG